MTRSKVIITPSEAFSKSYKDKIEKQIQESVTDELGEYEIWGEFFGRDDNVYALFLKNVRLEEDVDREDQKNKKIKETIKSLESRLKEATKELDVYRTKPEKYSLGELTVRYSALPFCEGCGERYTEFGVEIEAPEGGTSWCLPCFASGNELCEQDIATIERTLKKKEKAYYKKKLRE